MSTTVALRCDGGPDIGVGHLVRCLALAEELVARGVRVVLLGEIHGVDWVLRQYRSLGVAVAPAAADPTGLVEQVRSLGAGGVVLDGYDLPPGLGAALRRAGVGVLALVDGSFGAGQEADAYLDQNLDAPPVNAGSGADQLLGLDHVLFRDAVLRHRHRPDRAAPPRPESTSGALRVLTVFGGTDAFDASPVVTPLVLATGRPVHVIAVAARPSLRTALERVQPGPGQQLEIRDPDPDLPGLAASCDLAVTAAGSSVWELLCLGVPCALVQVVDNQSVGYERVVGDGLATGLGHLGELESDPGSRARAVAALDSLLNDAGRREALTRRGVQLVDGRGRERVADAFLRHVR